MRGLIGVAALGFVFRVIGLGHGLPHPYHIDENVIVWLAAASATGEPAPTFHYPPCFPNLIALVVRTVFGLGSVLMDLGPLSAWRIDDHPLFYFLIARLVSALLGTASIALTWGLARACGSSLGEAALAAGLVAVAPAAVAESHFAMADTAQAAMVALGLWGLARAKAGGGKPRPYAEWWWGLAGAGAGLAFATKYVGGVLIVPVLGLAMVGRPEGRPLRTAGALAGFLGGALLGLGPAALEPGRLFHDAFGTASQAVRGVDTAGRLFAADPANLVTGWAVHARLLWSGFGPIGLLVAALGLAAWWRRDRAAWGTLALPGAVLFLTVIPWHFTAARYALPIYPVLAVLAAGGVAALWRAINRAGQETRPYKGLVVAAVTLMVGWPLVVSARANAVFLREDTRSEALRWLVRELPAGTVVARENYCPQIPRDKFRVVFEPVLGRRPIGDYRRAGCRYLITSSYVSGTFQEADRLHDPGMVKFYEELGDLKVAPTRRSRVRSTRGVRPVREWPPRVGQPGPLLRLYELTSPTRSGTIHVDD